MRKTLSNIVKSMDIYGHQINLTFKGESTHKTVLGGIFTFIANVIIMAFFIYQLLSVISNTPSINNSFYSRDLTTD